MSTTIRLPNRIGQLGTYKTGTPNYVDVDNTNPALPGMVTFAVKSLDDAWEPNDIVSILIKKDDDNYKVWTAQWDRTNEYLYSVTEEESIGTIADDSPVTIIGVPTANLLDKSIIEIQSTVVAENNYTVLATDKGKQICCTSSSPVTITFPSTLPIDFYCSVIQEGTGKVALISSGTDTINGIPSRIYIKCRYKSAYVYQRIKGTWIALVGPPYEVSKDPHSDNVVLFMDMEGNDNDLIFKDLAIVPHTFTTSGTGVSIQTDQKKWGMSSGYTNQSGQLIADVLDNDQLPGDFTIEFWYYLINRTIRSGAPGWIGWGAFTAGIRIYMSVINPIYYLSISLRGSNYVASDSVVPVTSWTHIAIVRSGSSIISFLNGVKKNVTTSLATIAPYGNDICVLGTDGYHSDGTANGYMDSVRVTKGVARYTESFDPATLTEFPVPSTA